MSVRVGRVGDGPLFGKEGANAKGSFGFRVGVRGPLDEYRNNLIFGKGLDVGVTADGREFFLSSGGEFGPEGMDETTEIELRLSAERAAGDLWKIRFEFGPPGDGKWKSGTSMEVREEFLRDRLRGNVALVANFPGPRWPDTDQAARLNRAKGNPAGTGQFWFSDWTLEGEKVDSHGDRAFGPILFSQYTLHDNVVKLTAQMPPIGEQDSQSVSLQLKDGDGWKTVGEEKIHPQARTATFRIENWDATKDVPYRLAYEDAKKGSDGSQPAGVWEGTIRRDPVDKPVLTVADISCNIHAAFPNHEYVANVAKLDPDLIAFVGDQFYESSGGYGVVRKPLETAIDDYLRKWYMHGWTWRELTRDRPSVSLPDDHDVYQGNVWGEAGAAEQGTQESGGYNMHPEWVNVVHRTQTSHHPDAYDPMPVQQNISVYYGPLTYGRVSFAILADRQFKTGPEGVVPPTGSRGDHVIDPNFDPKTADVAGAELLGERQLTFLREWAAEWRGADMKCVISQTIFTSMATTHGGERMRLIADYDSNGWPQTARNAALREIRKCFAIHLAGDQHLPAVVHYGIDEHRDAGVAFAGPAVNVGYPRWWEPK
ncbi:MAG: alkaline phosphatase D family protein, partial [Planctomycetota bacterium]|nr:alkaline phosphatase D family protein [Planctomycetota bacterium]